MSARTIRRPLELALVLIAAMVLVAAVAPAVLSALGRTTYVVRSGSMTPNIPVGALIVDEPLAGNPSVGDVVTLRGHADTLVTHRVTRVVTNADGLSYIETKGDANNAIDPVLTPVGHVVGRVAVSVPLAGYITFLFSTLSGKLTFVLLGATLVVGLQLLDDEEAEAEEAAAEEAASGAAGSTGRVRPVA